MEKVQVVVIGLSVSPASNNAYALLLKEFTSERRVPIIIGAFEAQAIALELEGVVTPRPMTHDLAINLIESLGTRIDEVYINEINDGTFYSRIYLDNYEIELDSRPSDAVALALRNNAPIYMNSEILEEMGFIPENGEPEDFFEGNDSGTSEMIQSDSVNQKNKRVFGSGLDKLQSQLEDAISKEDYELAAKLRDEMKRYSESQ